MASTSRESPPPPTEERRNWLDLPREVTASILSRLLVVDILTSAQFVCKSWLEISNDPLIWRRIDMYKVGGLDLKLDLVRMCRHAVHRSSGQLADINIDYFGNNDLLEYIADRSNNLKRLRLMSCYQVSEDRMTGVIAKFPLLEELDLTHCPFSTEFINVIGRSCPRLESFKLNCLALRVSNIDPDDEAVYNAAAVSIGKSLPALRRLQLIGNPMTDAGLAAILEGCPRLESLDLRRCVHLSMNGSLWKRCAERVKHLRHPYEATEDCDFITGQDDDSDLGSFDDFFHHWFSGGEDDFEDAEYLEYLGGEADHCHSDAVSGDELSDYDDLF